MMTELPLDHVKLNFVATLDDANEFARWLGERRITLGVDTETGGFEWWHQQLRLVTVGDARTGWAIPWEGWGGLIREKLPTYEGRIALHNLKFDDIYLQENGVVLPRPKLQDTMLQAHAIDPTQSIALKSLSARRVDPRAASGQQQLAEAMRKQGWTWATVPVDFDVYWMYGALDAVLTALLDENQSPLVETTFREIYELELACVQVLANMERRGARIDVELCTRRLAEARYYVEAAHTYLRETWGIENPNSNPQVSDALIRNGVQLTQRTPSGKMYKLGEDILKRIDHPIAQTIITMRKVDTRAENFFNNFLKMADGDVLHCNIHPVGARTGRMSISNPALQTLPRESTIRDAFIPRDDSHLLLADFDQVEMRVFAHFAQEQGMIQAIHDGIDLHDYVCCVINGLPYGTKPPRELRQITKNANFAKVYVAGVETFARTAKISFDAAAEFIANYDQWFPGVNAFHQTVDRLARERYASEGVAYITTPYGRRHPVEPDKTYKLVNYLIQGTCADVFKRKLVELDAAGVGDYMVLPMHDEIVFDVSDDELDEVRRVVEKVMPEPSRFSVPLSVSVDEAERWGDKYRDEIEPVLSNGGEVV